MDDPASTGQTLLLVEDNEDNRIIYCTVLRHLGYEVIEAQDGVRAVELARSVQPDLILMDISIPRMDGWEATRILRGDPRTSGIPIIALTAHAMSSDRERALEAGCDDYDTKPIELPRLLGKIEALLGAGAKPPA